MSGPPKAQPRPPACPAPWDIWGNWKNGAEPRLVMEVTGPSGFITCLGTPQLPLSVHVSSGWQLLPRVVPVAAAEESSGTRRQ
ncbi:uncharacterized protein ACIBXB_021791 isoform 2-T4 [Morphnus guianensis]